MECQHRSAQHSINPYTGQKALPWAVPAPSLADCPSFNPPRPPRGVSGPLAQLSPLAPMLPGGKAPSDPLGAPLPRPGPLVCPLCPEGPLLAPMLTTLLPCLLHRAPACSQRHPRSDHGLLHLAAPTHCTNYPVPGREQPDVTVPAYLHPAPVTHDPLQIRI